jgi:hypothetical protein
LDRIQQKIAHVRDLVHLLAAQVPVLAARMDVLCSGSGTEPIVAKVPGGTTRTWLDALVDGQVESLVQAMGMVKSATTFAETLLCFLPPGDQSAAAAQHQPNPTPAGDQDLCKCKPTPPGGQVPSVN